MPNAMLQQMLTQGLKGAGKLQVVVGWDNPETMLMEAHRLYGAAGTLGLSRIAGLAGAIEA